jgi:hypothetical protein
MLTCSCPHCGRRDISFEIHEAHTVYECAQCGGKFTPLGGAVVEGFGQSPAPPDPFDNLSGPEPSQYHPSARAGGQGTVPKHSGLGMASFVIALLVGGLDVVLAVVIVAGIARTDARHADMQAWKERVGEQILAGGMAMVCLNCMSIPLCLVGVGLALVGLIGQRGHAQLFSWIGLLGNGVVILGVLGLYLYGVKVT